MLVFLKRSKVFFLFHMINSTAFVIFMVSRLTLFSEVVGSIPIWGTFFCTEHLDLGMYSNIYGYYTAH